jgi:hypothetical protein
MPRWMRSTLLRSRSTIKKKHEGGVIQGGRPTHRRRSPEHYNADNCEQVEREWDIVRLIPIGPTIVKLSQRFDALSTTNSARAHRAARTYGKVNCVSLCCLPRVGSHDEVLTTFSSVIMRTPSLRLLLESPSKGEEFTVRHRQSFTIIQSSHNE